MIYDNKFCDSVADLLVKFRGAPSAKKVVASTDHFEAANGVTAAANGVTAATSKKCGFKNLTLQIQLVAFNTVKSCIAQFQMLPAGSTRNQLVAFGIGRGNFFQY